MSPISRSRTISTTSFLTDALTPLIAFSRLRGGVAFLFESTEPDSRLARFSIVGCDPVEIISVKGNEVSVFDTGNGSVKSFSGDPKTVLQSRLRRLECDPLNSLEHLPFTGGLVGYMGYQTISCFEPVERQSNDPFGVPDSQFGLYDSCVVFDHFKRAVHVISHRGLEHVAEIQERLAVGCVPTLLSPLAPQLDPFANVNCAMPKADFLSMVNQAKEFIYDGQAFQIVVSQRFSVSSKVDPLLVYRHLQPSNPSTYSYMLEFPDFSYVGSSPETLLKSDGRRISTTALAGTRARGEDELADAKLEADLKANEKEMAEHLMLVDLARNDIGKVAAPGSVQVGELATVIKFSHVMHLATEVSGELAPGVTALDALVSCFPAGTVSGAPKVRAMQLLSEIEPEQRGIYSGMVGYLDSRGKCDAAIAIRSALLKDGVAHINAGAGIVADSDPEAEYQETRSKASALIKAVLSASQQ